MPGRRPANPTQARQNRLALIIALCAAAALGGLILIVVLHQPEPIDPNTGCLLGTDVPEAHTIVLIDQTDALSETELVYAKTVILREYMRLNLHDGFSIVGLRPLTSTLPEAKFFRCRVQTRDAVDPIYQNPRMVAQRFNKLVGAELTKVIDGLQDTAESDTSPIVETIDGLTGDVTFASTAIRRRLVIVSDMAQNTPRLTHYVPHGTEFTFGGLNGFVARHSLAGMQVHVHYVLRDKLSYIQRMDHERFWKEYFEASGAKDVQIGWGLKPLASTAADSIDPLPPRKPLGATGEPMVFGTPIPPSPAPPTPEPAPPSTQDSPPPAALSVTGTIAPDRSFMRYEVRWPQITADTDLRFDARRVLLVTLSEPGCYLTLPIQSALGKEKNAPLSAGLSVRRLVLHERSERSFAQDVAADLGAPVGSIDICEVVGARLGNTRTADSRYRAMRCGERGAFENIDEQTWARIAGVTSKASEHRLAIASGRPRKPEMDLMLLSTAVRDRTVCVAEAETSIESRVNRGLAWH
jgi:hypothetical protein